MASKEDEKRWRTALKDRGVTDVAILFRDPQRAAAVQRLEFLIDALDARGAQFQRRSASTALPNGCHCGGRRRNWAAPLRILRLLSHNVTGVGDKGLRVRLVTASFD